MTDDNERLRLSELVQQQRADLGMTQAELASALGVQQQTVGRWEQGGHPQRRYWARLTSFLDLRSEADLRKLIDNGSPPRRDNETNKQRVIKLIENRIGTGAPLTDAEAALFERLLDGADETEA